MTKTTDFSLIIACYNEERVLKDSINKIMEVFDKLKLDYEVIFVDDKSTDKTVNIIKGILKDHPDWKLVEHSDNKGRGASVSDGIRASSSPIIGFIDIDLSTSPWYLIRLIYEIERGADVATAMRVYKLRPKTTFRWILSKGYRFLVRLVLHCDLEDTETGCKVFNRSSILPILETIEDKGWFWDTEIMVRSLINGYKIVEVPTIFMREGLFTTVRVLRDTKNYIVKLNKFRHKLRQMRLK